MFDKALADLNTALVFDKRNEYALRWRGLTYRETGMYEKAVSDFSEAAGTEPQEMENYNLRAMVYAKQGRFAEAVNDLRKGIENGDEFFIKRSKAHKGRAQMYRVFAEQIGVARQKAEYERLAEEDYKTLEKLTVLRE